MTNKFELLLPVGQLEMALAAIHNGADAIFVGFPGFNARGRSYDFEVNELKQIIDVCHLYGVRVNLAFNIVIFENELEKVVDAINKILPLKPDALIVQDLGLVRLIRQMAPDQPIHASTQMTVTNDLAIKLVDDLKIKRFVLGRENSLSEIKLIREQTDKELEVFVHGALCVSYSGQCFTSETIGGRSANRGQCAQSCRFTYDLIVDGETKNNFDRNYLVSPQDLCGIAEIPELMRIGVESFKVEGRLKTPEYVASAARSYRSVMDKFLKNQSSTQQEIDSYKRDMAVQYSRGFFSGWLHGVDHQRLVEGTYNSHRGSLIGSVVDFTEDSLTIKLHEPIQLENGDGVLWVLPYDSKKPVPKEKRERGSFLFSIEKLKSGLVKVGVSKQNSIDSTVIGSAVYFNHDKDLKKEIAKSYVDKNEMKRIPIQMLVQLSLGQKLTCTISDDRFSFSDQTDSVLQAAQKIPVSEESICDELSALSGTIFKLDKIQFSWTSDQKSLFISQKEVKQVRQRLTEKLTRARQESRINTQIPAQVVTVPNPSLFNDFTNSDSNLSEVVKLNILLREKKQVEDVVGFLKENDQYLNLIDSVILDFEFGRDYFESLDLLKKSNIKSGLATTRILKPNEYQNLKNIRSMNPDVILVRNLGAIHYFTEINPFAGELRGDFSLNVTNHLTANYLLSKNLNSICLSYDLNADQAGLLIDQMDSKSVELTIHQYMPSFHMEHCVFAAFLSRGHSFKDCGKPCEKHKVQLKDQFGHSHWIKPDQECRNTMYNSKAQTALKYLQNWDHNKISAVRFEALNELGYELTGKIHQYLKYFTHEQSLEQTLSLLSATESYGLSAGNLSRLAEYQPRKKEF